MARSSPWGRRSLPDYSPYEDSGPRRACARPWALRSTGWGVWPARGRVLREEHRSWRRHETTPSAWYPSTTGSPHPASDQTPEKLTACTAMDSSQLPVPRGAGYVSDFCPLVTESVRHEPRKSRFPKASVSPLLGAARCTDRRARGSAPRTRRAGPPREGPARATSNAGSRGRLASSERSFLV
jgi:hypothetical protein